MDPRTTLEGQTVSTIGDLYFGSLNDQTTKKLHIVESRQASPEEIQADVKVWWGGFSACAKLFVGPTAQLPPIENVMTTITKAFPDKAKLVA